VSKGSTSYSFFQQTFFDEIGTTIDSYMFSIQFVKHC